MSFVPTNPGQKSSVTSRQHGECRGQASGACKTWSVFFFSSDLKGTWLAGRDPEWQERADSTELRQTAVAPGLRRAPADPGTHALAWDSTQMPLSRSGTADHNGHSRAEDRMELAPRTGQT